MSDLILIFNIGNLIKILRISELAFPGTFLVRTLVQVVALVAPSTNIIIGALDDGRKASKLDEYFWTS